LSSAASDLALIEAAAREAGALIRASFGASVAAEFKDDASPVTAVDRAADDLLRARLIGARPDYGWLSEETADNDARLAKSRLFIVDPLDGTRSFLAGRPEFCVSIALVEDGQARLGAVFNPVTEEMFLGGPDGATLNGAPVAAAKRTELEGARLVGHAQFYTDAKRWPVPWPRLDYAWKNAISYRVALIAAGQFDAALMFGFKHEWDLAGAAAILAAAGGRLTDFAGDELRFNQADPRAPGAIASGGPLHPLLIERVKHLIRATGRPNRRAPPRPGRELRHRAMTDRQLLHLVIGGELKALERPEFADLSAVDFVGAYPNYAAAFAAWKAVAQRTVDNARMRYFIIHAHRLLDPEQDDEHGH
jgi:myo-inositol-1(or 4)-monophosphatase